MLVLLVIQIPKAGLVFGYRFFGEWDSNIIQFHYFLRGIFLGLKELYFKTLAPKYNPLHYIIQSFK